MVARYVTFTNGVNSIQINMPVYGYAVDIVMPIATQKDAQGSPSFFDAPVGPYDATLGAYDYRVLNTATWRIPAAQQTLLSAFFKDADRGRSEPVIMTLQTDSGFYPFGPDLGDTGSFTVQLLTQDQGGRLSRPWNHFENQIQLVLITPPGGYSLPTPQSEGNFAIGSASGLRYCDFTPLVIRNIGTALTASGVPCALDGSTSGDSYETGWTQLCNQGNAAALLSLLVSSSGRASDLSIVAPSNFYPFGVDNGSGGAGTFTAKLLGSKADAKTMTLTFTHDFFNRWSVPLNFWLKAAA